MYDFCYSGWGCVCVCDYSGEGEVFRGFFLNLLGFGKVLDKFSIFVC